MSPFGELLDVPERGTLMGNRGCLHDAQRTIRRQWAVKRWITCVLEFRGRHREIMQTGRYTELFFLDEATSYAAGHRPCFECRRPDALRFVQAWREANPGRVPAGARIDAIDAVLHGERTAPLAARPLLAPGEVASLPNGAFVTLEAEPDVARLVRRAYLHRWTPAGYSDSIRATVAGPARLLTPPSIVNAFRQFPELLSEVLAVQPRQSKI